MNNNNNNNNKRRHHHSNNGKNRSRQRFQPERPSINKVYDSNSPGGGRQRGNASTLYEKYTTLARDAHSSGDRVLSENYMQYAEHYLRIVNSIQEQMQSVYREQYRDTEQLEGDVLHSDISAQSMHNYDNVTVQSTEELQSDIQSSPIMISDSSDDVQHKPIMRRKSYPFARRKPYDSSQVRQHQGNDDVLPAHIIRSSEDKTSRDDTSHTTVVQDSHNTQIPNNGSYDSSSEGEMTKPRRVIRRRIVAKDTTDNEKENNSKNPSSDE